jgi:hypothetical protein
MRQLPQNLEVVPIIGTSSDRGREQTARRQLQADWGRIEADIESGNVAQLQKDMQLFKQHQLALWQDHSKTQGDGRQLAADHRQLDRDESQLLQEMLLGNSGSA